MGVNDRFYPNFEGNERVNLPDFVAIRDRVLQDFRHFVRTYLDDSGKHIGKLYLEGVHDGLTFKIRRDVDRKFHDSLFEFLFMNASTSGYPYVDVILAPGTTNYVGVKIKYTKYDLQTRPFWDTDLGVSGEEFFDDMNIKVLIEEEFTSSTSPLSSDYLTLWTVVTGPASITTATRTQDHLWHPVPATLLATASRSAQYDSISTMRQYLDTMSALLAELKGNAQEATPWSTIKLLREFQLIFYTGGGDVAFEKTTPGSNLLEWSANLAIEIAGRGTPYSVAAGNATLVDGDCLYVEVPDGAPVGPLATIVAQLSDVPVSPLATGHSPRIVILFFRRGGTVFGMMDIPELDSGEVGNIGIDLPQKIRNRLGIISENMYEAFTDTSVFGTTDSYAVALSKISRIHGAIKDPTGIEDRADSTLSYVGGVTREVTITPVVPYSVFYDGKESVVSVAKTLGHADAAGFHFFWLNSSMSLQTQASPPASIYNIAYIAAVLWDSVGAKGKIADERHGINYPWSVHRYNHRAFGAQYISGFDIGGYTPNVDNDSSVTISLTPGTFLDEDVDIDILDTAPYTDPFHQNLADPAQLEIFYRRVTTGDWTWDAPTGFLVKIATGVPQINNPVTFAQTPVTSTWHFNMYVVATNFQSSPMAVIQGQHQYLTANEAQNDENFDNLILGAAFAGFSQEVIPCWKITFQYDATFGGTTKCKIIGEPVDIRRTRSPAGTSSASAGTPHNTTTNRDAAGSHPAAAIAPDVNQFSNDPDALNTGDTDMQLVANALDARTVIINRIIRQNKTIKLIEGGDWYWDGSSVVIGADAYIQIAGLLNVRNTIQAQTLAIPATHVVYVTMNRTGVAVANLALSTAAPESVPSGDSTYIVARRSGQNLIVGNDNLKLVPGQVGALGAQESIYTEFIAGENLGDLDAVYVSPGATDGGRTAGYVYKTDASVEVRARRFVGFAPKAVVSGSPINIQEYGRLKGFVAAGKARTAGAEQFLSESTPGALRETPPASPNFQASVGYAKITDVIQVIPVAAYRYSDTEPTDTAGNTTGSAGASQLLSRGDHVHGQGAHTHADASNGGAIWATAESGAVSSSTSGQVGTATTAARQDHNHDLGSHDHSGAAAGGVLAFGGEPGAVSSSTSGTAGVASSPSRSDHSHDLGTHAHTTVADGGQLASGAISDFNEAAQDAVGGIVANSNSVSLAYVDGTPSITATAKVQNSTSINISIPDGNGIQATTNFGTEPPAVSTSTSGTAGVANTSSRSDHGHDLGSHDHSSASAGGTLAFGAEPPAVSTSSSGTAGTATTPSRSDHGHDLGSHNHSSAADGGALSGTYGISISGNANTATNSTNAVTAANLTGLYMGIRSNQDVNNYRTHGFFALDSTPANAPTAYAAGVSSLNSDVGLQMAGGYSSDSFWHRGWWSSGSGWSAWRKHWDSGNMVAPAVAATANTLVQRDGSGYLCGVYGFFGYINTTANDSASATRIAVQTGDNYLRWATAATIQSFLGYGVITSGTFVPTWSAGGNVTAVTMLAGRYMRIGNIVTVNIDMNVTMGSATNWYMYLSIPIASALATSDLSGTGSRYAYYASAVEVICCYKGSGNNVQVNGKTADASSNFTTVTYQYKVN